MIYGGNILGRSLLFLFVFISFLLPSYLLGVEDENYRIRRVKFEGNDTFSSGILREVIATQKSPTRLSVWFNTKISHRFGSPPIYLDEVAVEEDIRRIQRYYADHGFFFAEIEADILYSRRKPRVRVKFIIEEGTRSYVERIEMVGFDKIESDIKEKIRDDRRIQVGDRFNKRLVEEEYHRILNILYNTGYAKATVDDVQVEHFRSTNDVQITFFFSSGERYVFGEIEYQMEVDRSYRIERGIYRRQLEYIPGDIYSLEKRTKSERNLNRLGIFESARIAIRIPPPEDTIKVIPSVVLVRPRYKHEITPEFLVNDENNAFNIGLGMGYSNRNYLGGARILTVRSRFRIQSIQDLNIARVLGETGLRDQSLIGGIELIAQVTQPYIVTRQTSGRWGISYRVDKFERRRENILRNRLSLNHQFASTTFGFADWTLERVALRRFIDDVDDVITEEPQFHSILSFTLQRDRTDDVFSPKEGFFHSITVEHAGILPTLLSYLGEQLPYSQYVKTTVTGRWYFPLDHRRYNIFATRFNTGYGTLYNKYNDTPIPLHRRFYGGGSGSVRGWKARALGILETPDEGGNFIVEGNMELRINILRRLGTFPFDFKKLWGVLFFDYGNVWESSSEFYTREVALAVGFGLRYETMIGPIRIDFGYRLYDPLEEPGREWLADRKFFRSMAVHFGIGQAF